MSMHATVNTNASSALNTQKSINSYDGGVQSLHLENDVSGVTVAGPTGTTVVAMTVGVPKTVTSLENVSTITVVADLKGGGAGTDNSTTTGWIGHANNTDGVTLVFTFAAAATAGMSATDATAKTAAFKAAVYKDTNEWTCNVEYGATVTQGDLGDTILDPSCLSQHSTAANLTAGILNFVIPKCLDTTSLITGIKSITLHRRARGVNVIA
jgi:hypothetical protein